MKQLKFEFWGSQHEVDYICDHQNFPPEILAIIVYPKDDEIRIMIGDSKTFTFQKEKEEITWDCSEKSRILNKLCKAIAEALMQTITSQNR